MSKANCLVWVVLILAGCGDASTSRITETDSAGVRVTVTDDTPLVFAELDSIPSLSIGGADVAGPTQFFRVLGIVVDKARRLWVADGQSGEVRVFEPSGAHWKTRGGRGEGPGEFVQVRLLGAMNADSVLAGDSGADRITVFDPEADFVRTERLPSSERPAPRPFDVFDDGSVLGQLPRVVSAASLKPGQILHDSVELVRVELGSTVAEPYGAAAGPLWFWTGRSQVPIPFTVNASFDVVGSEVHLVSGPEFRVRVLDRGGLREMYGVKRGARAVTSSDIDGYRAYVEEYIPEQMRPEYLAGLDSEARPKLLPGYDRVLASTDGHVWAQVYESDLWAPHEWEVFDGQGRFVGQVRVWTGFHPMVITQDALVGVWRNPMGVEYVRAYRFTRP